MSSRLRCFHVQAVACFCTFAVALAIGCGGGSDTDTEKDTSPAAKPAATTPDSAKAKVKAPGKKKANREARAKKRQEDAVANYPEDVPLYPGAKLVESELAKKGGGVSVTLESTDALPDAVATLSSMLEKDGWFVQSTTRDETHFIFADKGTRNLSIDVWATEGDKGTTMRLLVFDLE